jgi:ribosome biogenesis protein Tsr3
MPSMHGTISDEADNKQNTTEKNEKKTKIQSFAKSFASNTVVNNSSKKPISCTDNQIVSLYPFDN